jgi:MOSC domain-containing protein YiiM
MPMKVLSVNRSLPRTVLISGKEVSTGIYKEPASGPVTVHKLGLEGDGQADLTVHGGPFQALYAYPIEHYAHWQSQVLEAGPLSYGAFGENLTLSGLLETEVCVGDVHRIGGVLLQVTAPRIPCFKLGHKLNRPNILKPFLQSGRSGFYYRVLQEGMISSGQSLEIVARDSHGITVRTLLGISRMGEPPTEEISKTLEIEALAPYVRRDLEDMLRKASANP